MAWNRIRRRLTRELDTQIGDFREVALDKLLTAAWKQYAASLSSGEVLELEAGYEAWVAKALDDAVTVTVDAPA